jgi:hypothetical protein
MSLIKKKKGPYSPSNMFLLINENRYKAGLAVFTDILRDAPLGRPRPEALRTVSAVVAGNNIEFSWTLITNVPKTDRLILWIRSINAKIHPQVAGNAPCFPAGTFTISTVRAISGIPISIPPGVYELQAQTVNDYGKTGVVSELLRLRVGPDNLTPVFYSPRQTLVALPLVAADIPWTTVSVAGIVPPQANGLIIYAEIFGIGPNINSATLAIRKAATQGPCIQLVSLPFIQTPQPKANNGIVPITDPLTFDYSVLGVLPLNAYGINIFAIGYIH